MNQSVDHFSRVYEIGRLPKPGLAVEIAATAEECAALAKRAAIPQVKDWRAQGTLRFLPHSDVLEIRGQCQAMVTQICVRSLEPFTQLLQFDFVLSAMDAAKIPAQNLPQRKPGEEVEITADGFEPIVNGRLDLGELLAQQFLLELDPYPKNPDAGALGDDFAYRDVAANPLVKLKLLKNN
jgi:hypothetical protein